MVLQQDRGSAPPPFDTGLPRTQSSDDVPRWLVVLGILAACTLFVALLRYAIDLLGVVFLIILVGFSIRAVSDWLTEGESVSGWALAAVVSGLFGTVMVGLWLFGSRDITTGALERGLPSSVVAVADWLETHGWGQRVLLAGGGGATTPSGPGTSEPLSSQPGAAPVSPRSQADATPSGASRGATPEPALRDRRGTSRAGDEADAATPSSSGTTGKRGTRPQELPGAAAGTPEPTSPPTPSEAPPATQPAVDVASIATTTSLVSSHSTSAVGTSVRFTATVTSDGSGVPTGVVTFFDGDRAFGTAAVHGAGASVTAGFSTLDLGIGDHQITAEFHGTHGFLGSRSEAITQTITRH